MDTPPKLIFPESARGAGADPPAGPDGRAAQSANSTGRLRRFVVPERLSHWLYALCFIAAFVTGLLMWIPATRIWLAGDRYPLSQYHGYVGTAMVLLPLILMLVLAPRRLGGDIREVDNWSGEDRHWFRLAVRGYTLRGRAMPPQGRFNAGQKLNVVIVAAMAIGFAATGGILMHKQDVAPWLVSRALWLHTILAVLAIALFAGHLAHVFLTKHGRTYLWGMVWGWIPEDLARERHLRWWQVETGGELPAADPAGVAGAHGGAHSGAQGDGPLAGV
jgi:formate dehydrogenase subunit gamma